MVSITPYRTRAIHASCTCLLHLSILTGRVSSGGGCGGGCGVGRRTASSSLSLFACAANTAGLVRRTRGGYPTKKMAVAATFIGTIPEETIRSNRQTQAIGQPRCEPCPIPAALVAVHQRCGISTSSSTKMTTANLFKSNVAAHSNNGDDNHDDYDNNSNSNRQAHNDNDPNKIDNNNNGNQRQQQEEEELKMENLYQQWSISDDRFLHEHRHEDITKLASQLGRGLNGVRARLQKLTNVDSLAYRRLFVDKGRRDGGIGDDGDGCDSTYNDNNDEADDEYDDAESKSKKLTPALEVLRRIKWDDTLPSSDFAVLHYDRVDDVIEETNFDTPNRSISGKERLLAFAIPEHRIVSIKYKERIVWNRPTRVDRVFGSANGNGITIDVIMKTYDEWKKQRDDREEERRKRMVEVTERVKVVLGEGRFEELRSLSSRLQQRARNDAVDDDVKGGKEKLSSPLLSPSISNDVRDYVKSALKLFRSAREEDGPDVNIPIIPANDVEALDLLSDLVALLSDDTLRECILREIEMNIDRLEGRKPQITPNSTGRTLPDLDEDDVAEKFVRGSGPGGQKINKTANRVILVHGPTQIRVECQDTRSLQQNRKIARKRLRQKLDEYYNGELSRTSLKAAKIAKKKSRAKARSRAKHRKQQTDEEFEFNE